MKFQVLSLWFAVVMQAAAVAWLYMDGRDLRGHCADLERDVRSAQEYGEELETTLDHLESKLASREIYWEPPGRPPWVGIAGK